MARNAFSTAPMNGRVASRSTAFSAKTNPSVAVLSEIEALDAAIQAYDRNADVTLSRDTRCSFGTYNGLCSIFKIKAERYCLIHKEPGKFAAIGIEPQEYYRGMPKIAEMRKRLADLKAPK